MTMEHALNREVIDRVNAAIEHLLHGLDGDIDMGDAIEQATTLLIKAIRHVGEPPDVPEDHPI